MTAIRGAASRPRSRPYSVLQQWPQTFYIDIKSPDAEPAVMGERLLEVLKIPIASTGYGFIPPKTAISPLCRNRSPLC